jgi:hypothetical protein
MANTYKVGISAEDAGYTSTIKKVNKSTETIDDTVKGVASKVTSSFASMVKAGAGLALGFAAIKVAGAAVRGVIDGFSDAIDLGGKLNDLSSRTGETAGNLTVLSRAFENAGVSSDKVGTSINKMQKFMDDASQGVALSTDALYRLGLSYEDLQGKTPTAQMELLAARIASIQDPTERASLAMKVFGKSGGELMPLFMGFSDEMSRARDQLGALPGVIDRSNVAFDAISDNLAVIKTKFRDVAAGILDRLAPAIEFATTMLTRFDAAALGMKIGDILIGAGNGMKAFTDALKAVSLGEIGLAWTIAFGAIKLSAAEAFNSIYKNAVAALGGAVEFLKIVLGPSSGVWTMLKSSFGLLGAYLSKAIGSGLLAVAENLPFVTDEMRDGMKSSIEAIDQDIKTKSNQIKNALGQVPGDLIYGMKEAGKEFDRTLATTKDLINTSGMIKGLAADKLELQKATLAALMKEIEANNKSGATKKESVTASMKLLEIEADITKAKAEGNKQRQLELEASRQYYIALNKALKEGKSLEEAIAAASKARGAYVDDVVAKQAKVTGELKNQTKELKEQLNMSQQMAADISKFKADEKIDPSGKLRDKLAQQQAAGNTAGMDRTQRQLEMRESKLELNKAFNKEMGRDSNLTKNLNDMAKDLGLKTFGKKGSELKKDIAAELEKRAAKGAADPNKKGVPDPPKKAAKEDKSLTTLETIRDTCKEISGKLPLVALGA